MRWPALTDQPGAWVRDIDEPELPLRSEWLQTSFTNSGELRNSPLGISEMTGQPLLEEDCVVGGTHTETSLLIKVLRLLVLFIHEKHDGFGVGQQVAG